MKTRHADPDSPLSHERYMSASEFAELRGINGMAVAAKAMLVRSPAKRSLIMFLLARSWSDGGLLKVAEDVLEMFPERIGSPTMLKLAGNTGSNYTEKNATLIAAELGFIDADSEMRAALDEFYGRTSEPVERSRHYYDSVCRSAERLANFLTDLCINPAVLITEQRETKQAEQDQLEQILRAHDGLAKATLAKAELRGFQDICGALFEYRRRCTEAALTQYARTNAARKVFAVLDACHEARRIGLIEGHPDAGKSVPAEAWVRAHCGEAIYVRLTAITSKTSFFRALARELGIGGIYSRSSTEMQSRVEDILIRLKLTVVIDEAAYMFGHAQRIYSAPDLPDWVYTALGNHDVPVVLIATSMFSERMRQAARQVAWNSQQFRRRLHCYERGLPMPSRRDIELVAQFHAPEASEAVVAALTDYAMLSKPSDPRKTWQPLTDVVDTILDARRLARNAGRDITVKDVHAAIREFRAPVTTAKYEAFDAPREPRRRGRQPSIKSPQSEPLSAPETAFEEPSGEELFTGRRPVAALEMQPAESGERPAFQDA